jgi:WD40 repeat protein
LEGLNDDGEVVENYKVVKRLIGHQSGIILFCENIFILNFVDTVGVEWSPDGKVLASCGLDGTICFWNCDPSSSQTLLGKFERAHTGFIKGLAWDPSGKFLASQSDDGSCIVWNVESLLSSQATPFTLDPSESEMFKEAVLEKNFVNMSKMTFFHRPGWSPDGSLLALANSTNRQLPAVALIERSNWNGPGTFFIGHMGPVEAVKFNSRLFVSNSEASDISVDKVKKEMLCAVASQDGQISIWSSCSTSPLLVLQDLFEHSVMDLCWSPNGLVLVAVSYDGAAVAVKLSLSDLGLTALSDSDQAEHLRNCFGNRSLMHSESSQYQGYLENSKVVECLRENEQFLANHPHVEEKVLDIKSSAISPIAPPIVNSVNESLIPQNSSTIPNIPTVPTIVNGKKRITPQLLSSSATIGFGSAVGNSANSATNSQLSQTSRAGVRMRDEDFLIHRRLLERAGGFLLNSKTAQNPRVFACLDAEEIPEKISVSLSSGILGAFSVSVEVVNQKDQHGGRKPTVMIQSIRDSQIQWKERFRGNVYMASGAKKYSAFALKSAEDKDFVLILTSSGRRHLPPIAIEGRAVHLHISPAADLLSVVCETGMVRIWSLRECRLIFADSSIGNYLTCSSPARFISFKEDSLEVSYEENGIIKVLSFNSFLGCWSTSPVLSDDGSLEANATIPSKDDCAERIERLKSAVLYAVDEPNAAILSRSVSELEFELSLVFVNLRNGKQLNSQESAHFERALAIYALKLGKESRVHKARELMHDLEALKLDYLVHSLLKPLFSSSGLSLSSSWQDFLADAF